LKHFDPYENLANAIIIQACKDFRRAYKRYLRRYRSSDKPDAELLELESFFRSDWYKTLTSVDGEYLMDRIKKEVSA
jgi:hypothetical protein